MTQRAILIACVVLLSLSGGCGKAIPAATPQPSATQPLILPTEPSIPPTATVPPTDTLNPTPTPTPEKETGSAAEGLIAFYSERDGNAEIYTMRPDGSDPRRLTFNAFEDYAPVWSPDSAPGGCKSPLSLTERTHKLGHAFPTAFSRFT